MHKLPQVETHKSTAQMHHDIHAHDSHADHTMGKEGEHAGHVDHTGHEDMLRLAIRRSKFTLYGIHVGITGNLELAALDAGIAVFL